MSTPLYPEVSVPLLGIGLDNYKILRKCALEAEKQNFSLQLIKSFLMQGKGKEGYDLIQHCCRWFTIT